MQGATGYFLAGVGLGAILVTLAGSQEGRASLIAIFAAVVGSLVEHANRADLSVLVQQMRDAAMSSLPAHPIMAVGTGTGAMFVAIFRYRKKIAAALPRRYLRICAAVLLLLLLTAAVLARLGIIR